MSNEFRRSTGLEIIAAVQGSRRGRHRLMGAAKSYMTYASMMMIDTLGSAPAGITHLTQTGFFQCNPSWSDKQGGAPPHQGLVKPRG